MAWPIFSAEKVEKKTGSSDEVFLGEENEWLVIYSRQILAKEHFDYFIFGHRHLPLDIQLTDHSHYINLGDWIKFFTYGVFDGETLELKTYAN